MTPKLGVFVSSVQKELGDEHLDVQNLVNTDAFLSTNWSKGGGFIFGIVKRIDANPNNKSMITK